MRIYLAGPLFSVAQRDFNSALAAEVERLDAGLTVILPQERAKQFLGQADQNEAIYRDCLDGVRESDLVAAVLDGEDVDSGTALEIGYAIALGRPVLGLRSDLRASEERGVNLMVAFACDELMVDPQATVGALAGRIAAFAQRTRQVRQAA